MDKYFWKLICFVLIINLVASITINTFLQNDIDWHKQEVYDSWKIQEQETTRLQNEIKDLQTQLNQTDKNLAICEIIRILKDGNK